MRPGLQPGDVVITKRVPVSDLHVRDVIVFHPPGEAGQQTVHRIVRLKVRDGATVVTTRGDANSVNDPAVTALRGASAYRVVRVVPLVGYPAVWLSGGHHGLVMIGIGVLLVIVAGVVLLRPETQRKNSDVDAPTEDSERTVEPAAPSPAARVAPSPPRRFAAVGGARRAGADEIRRKEPKLTQRTS
jgi:signal peptidase I